MRRGSLRDWWPLLVLAVLALPRSSKAMPAPAPSGPRLTLAQLVTLATLAGFPDPQLAAAVAMAESGGVISAAGDSGQSIGLWQVNLPAHPEYTKDVLLTPDGNARAALAISRGGTDWSPWTQFRNNAYQQYMVRT